MNMLMLASRCGIACLAVAPLTACLQIDPLASEQLAQGAATSATIGLPDQPEQGSALQVDEEKRHSVRLSARREQEERRKMADRLAFFGIGPGMAVLNIHSGAERNAELLSQAVGPSGRVVTQDNEPYLSFTDDGQASHEGGGRPGSAEQPAVDGNRFGLAPDIFDAVILVRSYHDEYYVSVGTDWVKLDRPALLRELYSVLKPGGVLGFVDDAADPAAVRHDMVSAGFDFDEQGDIFRGPADDRSRPVFASPAGAHSEPVVLRFHKPGEE